jgi:hypothetical protein
MDWYQKQLSRFPTREEIDHLYFNLAMVIIAGLMLAFALGITVGSKQHHSSVAPACVPQAAIPEVELPSGPNS